MKKIINNYLCFTEKDDFDQKTLNFFFDRLSLFLNIVIKDKPKLVINIKYKNARAEYREKTNSIVFGLESYNINSSKFAFNIDKIKETIPNYESFKYAIPLADIYHELLHVYQYKCTDYKWNGFIELPDNFLEASVELFCMMLIGEEYDDYTKEFYALWYIMKRKLNIKKPTEQYNFIRNSIVNQDFINTIMGYKNMKQLIDKKYKGSIESFLKNFVKDFGDTKHYEECISDINAIHNLIFYQW